MENEAFGAAGLECKASQTASVSRDEIVLVYNEYKQMALTVLWWLGVRDAQEAEDILHDGVIKVLKRGRNVRNRKSYLFRTLRNMAYNRGRRSTVWGRICERIRPTCESQDPADAILRDEENVLVQRAVARLGSAERELLGFLACGISYTKMADMLGIKGEDPVNTVSQRVHRAKRSLRSALVALGVSQ